MEELISGLMSMRGHVTKGATPSVWIFVAFFFLGGASYILFVGGWDLAIFCLRDFSGKTTILSSGLS